MNDEEETAVWHKFAASYDAHDGKFGISIFAKSMEDAEARIKEIRETLRLDGQMVGSDE